MSTALIVNTVALPAYKSSYGLSAPPGVIYAQELRYGHAPTLGPSRAFNAEYVQAGPADLGYSQASRFGYAEGSTRHVYTNMHNYVSNNMFCYMIIDWLSFAYYNPVHKVLRVSLYKTHLEHCFPELFNIYLSRYINQSRNSMDKGCIMRTISLRNFAVEKS